MNLHDARALARAIQDAKGWSCRVPLGYGPEGYFVRIVTILPEDLDPAHVMHSTPAHAVDFYSEQEAEEWFIKAKPVREALNRRVQELIRQQEAPQRRSPLDILIDRAVGRE